MNTYQSGKTDGDRISEIADSPRPVSTNADEDKLATGAGKVLDYAGSSAKTDPEEIKLVRKLDLWMLVRTSVMACVCCVHRMEQKY